MISAVRRHLDDAKADIGLVVVGGAAAFQAAAETRPTATPAAYVYALDETPLPSADIAGDVFEQQVGLVVGIALVVRNVSDARGEAAQVDMDELRKGVKAALHGRVLLDGFDPLERGPGRLLAFQDGHMWWQDSYRTAYLDRANIV